MQITETEGDTRTACRQRGARRVSKKLKLKGLHFTAKLAHALQREKTNVYQFGTYFEK